MQDSRRLRGEGAPIAGSRGVEHGMEGRKDNLSKTMRIDLIPAVPGEPVVGKKRRVVISSSARPKSVAAVSAGKGNRPADYEELLQGLYDAAIVSDAEGRIGEVNARAVDFFQYTQQELLEMSVFDLISGSDSSLIATLCRNLESDRFTLIQAYCVRKGGGYFPAEIAVSRLVSRGLRLCFFVRDITLRKQAEEMLRTEHNALQNAGNGIGVADIDGRIEYVNPAMARLWAFDDVEEMVGTEMRLLFASPEEGAGMVEEILANRRNCNGEFKARRTDGTEFDVQVSAACNRNSDGEAVGIVFSVLDVSDRKRAIEAEREAERHRVMLESLGAVCHHMGQPATVLLGNLGLLQKRLQGGSDVPVRNLIATSIEAVESLGSILHKLNAVNEYRTTQYLAEAGGSASDAESRILDIRS